MSVAEICYKFRKLLRKDNTLSIFLGERERWGVVVFLESLGGSEEELKKAVKEITKRDIQSPFRATLTDR